jgi:hypothetical protein
MLGGVADQHIQDLGDGGRRGSDRGQLALQLKAKRPPGRLQAQPQPGQRGP